MRELEIVPTFATNAPIFCHQPYPKLPRFEILYNVDIALAHAGHDHANHDNENTRHRNHNDRSHDPRPHTPDILEHPDGEDHVADTHKHNHALHEQRHLARDMAPS